MIAKIPFGSTGNSSSRAIFGAAALAAMKPARTQGVFETLLEFGVNHIDTAAGYGDSELRLAPWLRERRDDFFLATKTAERTGAGARAGIERSLERLGVDFIDLIQLHNLVDPADWETAMGPGGALEATLEARDRVKASYREALRDVDALLTPTTATTAPTLESIDQSTTPALFTRIVNLLDYCALVLPNGIDKNGLPISLQVICRGYEEALALRIGRAYEQATGWHEATPPGFP